MTKLKKYTSLIASVCILLFALCVFFSCGSTDTSINTDTSTSSNTNTGSGQSTDSNTNTNTGSSENTDSDTAGEECEHALKVLPAVSATCTEGGLTEGFVCTKCDKVVTKQYEIVPLGHDYIDHEGKEATCKKAGWEKYQTCSRCDFTTYLEIDALGHNYVEHRAKEPTCTEVGWDKYLTCDRCDYSTYKEKDSLDHDYKYHKKKEPTCTEAGWKRYNTCSRCDYTTYEELPSLGHDYIHHDAQDSTCAVAGWDAYRTCSRCDFTTYKENPTLPHDYIDHEGKEPTCTEIGWDEYQTCSNCDYSSYNIIPATGHSYTQYPAREPGCIEIGWDAYQTCSACGDTSYNAIPAKGHDFVGSYSCNSCGEILYTPSEGLEYTLDESTNSYRVTSIGTCGDAEVVVPYTYEGLPVTKIYASNKSVFGNGKVTSVVIPGSVTEIGRYALCGSVALSNITVRDDNTSYKSIDGNLYSKDGTQLLFYATGKADELFVVPEGVISISSQAFDNNATINKIILSSSVETVDLGGLLRNEYIEVVENNETLKSVDGILYSKDGSILIAYPAYKADVSFDVPEGVTEIGDYAFEDNCFVEEMNMPSSLESIGYGAFLRCSSLKNVNLNDGLESISTLAFMCCYSLPYLVIPESVSYVGEDAFAPTDASFVLYCEYPYAMEEYFEVYYQICYPVVCGYEGEKGVTEGGIEWALIDNNEIAIVGCTKDTINACIPSEINGKKTTTITRNAFAYNENLESIEIPASVDDIWCVPFEWCISLANIIVDEGNEEYKSIDGSLYSKDGTSMLRYAIGKKDTTFELPYYVSIIESYAFTNSSYLKSIDTGYYVEEIRDYAFANCKALEKIRLSPGVVVGYAVFDDCEGFAIFHDEYDLSDWDPYWWEGIGDYQIIDNGEYKFEAEKEYSVITIDGIRYGVKDGIAAILAQDLWYFYHNDLKSHITYEGKEYAVTKIAEYAFSETNIEGMTIPNGITEIGDSAFSCCEMACDIEMPDSVIKIGQYAFENCISLTSMTLSKNLKVIDGQAFYECESLESIVIPEGVTTIADWAFYGCTSLTIYCEATSQPSGWSSYWNYTNCPVCWYSENEPTNDGNYWHYVDGEVVVWQ